MRWLILSYASIQVMIPIQSYQTTLQANQPWTAASAVGTVLTVGNTI